MTHIELSGFGINCKSTLIKMLYYEIPNSLPIYSDSDIITDMYSRYWASWEPEDRCRFRYHQIESMYRSFGETHHLLVDRGIIDQVIFAQMIDKGYLSRSVWIPEEMGQLSDDYSFIDDYIPYEVKYPFQRFFIYNNNRELVERVLADEKEKNVEKRSYFYKTVDEYMELQDKFWELYDSSIHQYTCYHIWNDCPVEESLKSIVEGILSTL